MENGEWKIEDRGSFASYYDLLSSILDLELQ
jgi:hypothetical protein